MKRFLWLGFVLFLFLICTGCGDTFRPIIIPNPPVFPNPQASHTILSINYNVVCSQTPNPSCDNFVPQPGTGMVIDVSGDTDVSTVNTGISPVHAVQQSASQVLVVNQAVTGYDPPLNGSCLIIQPNPEPVLNICPSISKLNYSGTVISSTSTITLPASSAANFVATTEAAQAYVLLPNYIPNIASPATVVPSIEIVNTTSDNLVNTVPVGHNPIAMAETPDGKKLYVANEGDSTISGFSTATGNLSQRIGSPTTTSSPPIWLSTRSDSQMVYVLEENGTLASLSTLSTAGPDTLTPYPGLAVPGANIMTYDPNLNRLYIAGGQELEIIDVSQSIPTLMTSVPIPIPPFALLNLPSVAATATSAAALPNGTFAYAASYATLPSQLTISSVSGDGTNATYAYTLTAGAALNPGLTINVTGTNQTGFDGTFLIGALISGTTACPGTCFQVPNPNTLASMPVTASGSGSNIFPQVTVVNTTSNTLVNTIALAGFPDATIVGSQYYIPACANSARFRFLMAAGGDSSRAYLSSCDGGLVDIINTSSNTYFLNLPAPVSSRTVEGNPGQNPPQNPVFLLAGP
jgi:DNA-binding beta-propeller fold protein YncE